MTEKYYFVYDQEWKEVQTEKEVLEFAMEQFYDKEYMFDEESLMESENVSEKDKKAYELGKKIIEDNYVIRTIDEAKIIFSVVDFKVKKINYPENPKAVIHDYEELKY